MSDSEPVVAILGDGVLTIEVPKEESIQMAEPIDLPANVAAQLQLESVGNIQATNQQNRAVSQMASGVLQAAMARNFDELGVVEGRSTSGVLGTPIAGPTEKQA